MQIWLSILLLKFITWYLLSLYLYLLSWPLPTYHFAIKKLGNSLLEIQPL